MAVAVALALTTGLAAASNRTVTFKEEIQITPKNPSSFDISWVENSTGRYFLADRTNNAVDLIDAKTDTFVGPIGKGAFTGAVPAASCPTGGNTCSGPDGVLTDSGSHVWVGDGNSTIKVFDPTANTGLIKSIATCPPSPACGTGGKARADEESFDPTHQLILIANDAEGFLTFVHVDETNPANSSVVGHFFYADNTLGVPASASGHATAGGGLEQSVWVPQTGLFYQTVPGNADAKPPTTGFIDVFDPVSMKLVNTFSVPGCDNGPTGLALGPNQRFLGACDNGAAAVEVRNGHVHTIVSGVGGADEIWFNPGDNNFYLGIGGTAGVLDSNKLGVVDADNDHVVTVISGKGGHSVAAYAANNRIFEPDLHRTADPAVSVANGVAVFVSSGSR
jgi:hypothetical protein